MYCTRTGSMTSYTNKSTHILCISLRKKNSLDITLTGHMQRQKATVVLGEFSIVMFFTVLMHLYCNCDQLCSGVQNLVKACRILQYYMTVYAKKIYILSFNI